MLGRPKLTPAQRAEHRRIGREVRALRRALGLTQRQLAEEIGIHSQQVSASERGAASAPPALRGWLAQRQGGTR